MEVEVNDRNGVRVLKLVGHVAASEIPSLIEELGKLKEAPDARCVLDTSVLKNLPTSAIGALIELIRHLERAGGRLILAAPGATIRVPLDRLGVSPMVTITESVAEAVEVLGEEDSPE
jgi:anti-anti-sigma factor